MSNINGPDDDAEQVAQEYALWPELTDVEADTDTLASAGYGTDEDYGCYGE